MVSIIGERHFNVGKLFDRTLKNMESIRKGRKYALFCIVDKLCIDLYWTPEYNDDMSKQDLSPQLTDIKAYILGYLDENNFAPTLFEIGERFGHGRSWAHYMVQELTKRGHVRVEPKKLRGIIPI